MEDQELSATRPKPSLRHGLKRLGLELSEQGERVTVEDVTNALLARCLEDEALRRTINQESG